MDVKTVAGSLMTLTVAVIVIALVALPVLNDTGGNPPYEGTNTGYLARLAEVDSSNDDFIYEYSGGTLTLTRNGDTVTVPFETNVPFVIDQSVWLRVRASTQMIYMDLENGTWQTLTGTSTFTVSDGNYTLANGGSTILTGTLSKCLIQTPDGDLGYYTSQYRTTLGESSYVGAFVDNANNGPSLLYDVVNGEISSTLVSPFVATTSGTLNTNYEVATTIDYEVLGTEQQVGIVKDTTRSWMSGTTEKSANNLFAIAPIAYESTGDEIDSPLLRSLSPFFGVIALLLIIVPIMVAARIIRNA